MSKKPIKVEDVKPEEIEKIINNSLNDKNTEENAHFYPKLMTFILLLIGYIYACVYIQDYTQKMTVIFFGLILLLIIFQLYIFPHIKNFDLGIN